MFHPDGPTFFELARQALSSTEHGYDLLANKFDVTPFRTPPPVLAAVEKEIRRRAPFGSAVDLCCGTGAGMEMLQPLCSERIVGVDFSQGMLDVARQNVAKFESPVFEFHKQNVLALEMTDQFDLAVSFSAFGHILPRDQDRFVSKVQRALKPGGYFIFATSRKPKFTSRDYWFSHGFNTAMRVRNLLIRPRFVMYYLTFLWPDVVPLLERNQLSLRGFSTDDIGGSQQLVTVISQRAG